MAIEKSEYYPDEYVFTIADILPKGTKSCLYYRYGYPFYQSFVALMAFVPFVYYCCPHVQTLYKWLYPKK